MTLQYEWFGSFMHKYLSWSTYDTLLVPLWLRESFGIIFTYFNPIHFHAMSLSPFPLSQAREKDISLTTKMDLGRHENFMDCDRNIFLADEENQLGSSPVVDVMVQVDRNKMSQVIHNLVSNAIKFTPRGGNVTVTVSLEKGLVFATEKRENNSHHGSFVAPDVASPIYLKITVADTGVGLSQVR